MKQAFERTQPSAKAYKQCAQWLSFCLDIGWSKSQLDALEKLWWEHHDFNGKLIKRQMVIK